MQRALELLAGGAHRTLSAFAAKVQDTALRTALAPSLGDGAFAHLFSGDRSPLRDGYLHVIEMEELLPLRPRILTPVVTHLFHEIERRLDGRPTLIIVEEAPNYLADTLFARRFRQQRQRGREGRGQRQPATSEGLSDYAVSRTPMADSGP